LKEVIDNLKLIELNNRLNEINKELEKNEDNIFHNKYFVYPVDSVIIIAIIFIIVGITLCKSKKWKRSKNAIPTST